MNSEIHSIVETKMPSQDQLSKYLLSSRRGNYISCTTQCISRANNIAYRGGRTIACDCTVASGNSYSSCAAVWINVILGKWSISHLIIIKSLLPCHGHILMEDRTGNVGTPQDNHTWCIKPNPLVTHSAFDWIRTGHTKIKSCTPICDILSQYYSNI